MLYKTSVSQELIETAQSLCALPELISFRMVGGTAIAFQIGHRTSIDIDLFSNEKADKAIIANVFRKQFPDAEIQISSHHIQTVIRGVKVELYDDWQNPFRYEPLSEEGIRLASLNDLAALKLNAITERREKKDYIDLYFLFNQLGQKTILEEFKEYNPLLSPKSILFALDEVNTAENNKSVMPEMLTDFSWKDVKKSMLDAAKAYLAMQPKTKSN